MGKAAKIRRQRKERRFYVESAPFLKPEPTTDAAGQELCIQCGCGSVAQLYDNKTRRTFYRTSPFRIVQTPHGKRPIHDACLWHIQKGLEGSLVKPNAEMQVRKRDNLGTD